MATVLVTVLILGVFIPMVQATTGAANEVRSKVIADVFMKTNAKQADVDRVQKLIETQVPHVGKVEFVSKKQALARQREAGRGDYYDLLGSNPLPDTFRITPGQPRQHRPDPRRARPGVALRRALGRRPGDRRGAQPRGGHGQDPLRDARGEAHDGAARACWSPPRCC